MLFRAPGLLGRQWRVQHYRISEPCTFSHISRIDNGVHQWQPGVHPIALLIIDFMTVSRLSLLLQKICNCKDLLVSLWNMNSDKWWSKGHKFWCATAGSLQSLIVQWRYYWSWRESIRLAPSISMGFAQMWFQLLGCYCLCSTRTFFQHQANAHHFKNRKRATWTWITLKHKAKTWFRMSLASLTAGSFWLLPKIISLCTVGTFKRDGIGALSAGFPILQGWIHLCPRCVPDGAHKSCKAFGTPSASLDLASLKGVFIKGHTEHNYKHRSRGFSHSVRAKRQGTQCLYLSICMTFHAISAVS